MRKFTLLMAFGMLVAFQLVAGNSRNNKDLIPFGATWKYLDNGSDQGVAWQETAFDDAGWKYGPALLGYGNPPYGDRKEATVIKMGHDPDNTHITAYFRKTITLDKGYETYEASVRRDDGVVVYVNGVEVYRDNMPKGTIGYKTLASYAQDNGMKELKFTIKGSAFVPGKNVVAVEIHQHSKSSSDLTFDLKLEGKGDAKPDPMTWKKLVPFKSVWKYLDNGTDQGTAWQALSFDDATWKSGPAILGYGNPPYNNRGEATKLSFGPNPDDTYITTYFRKTLDLDTGYESFYAKVKRDDGVVVYVNGVEVFRDHMPKGPINYKTHAEYAQDNGMKALEFSIKGEAFVVGKNVIAVEVHQHSKSSSDLTFDFELTGKGAGKPEDKTPPTVLSINRLMPEQQLTNGSAATFRVLFSEVVAGVDITDFALALTGLTGTINTLTPVGTDGKTFDVNVSAIAGNGTLGLNLKDSGTGITDVAGNAIATGFTGQTYTIDQTQPTLLSLNRYSPLEQTTSHTAVTFRATFAEAVSGFDTGDLTLALTGTVTAGISRVKAVGTDGKVYDIDVNAIKGNGTLGLNLNATGTGITDAAGNAIGAGFTGQTYTIQPMVIREGFASITPLTPLDAEVDATKEKQQAKVFVNAGKHWAVLGDASGTNLFRLDGTTWTKILLLSTRNNRADAIVDGNLTHVLMYGGTATTTPAFITQLITIEYVPATNTYRPWTVNSDIIQIPLDLGVETASLAKDGTGRLWVASAGVGQINVRYSDAPYRVWNGPITIATGVHDDDIAAAVYIPALRKIGVLWSNQNTDRFGFKTHDDGAAAGTWTADEVPASQSALNIGLGMADDHLNMKVASDGTVYAAVKTSYDRPGSTEIALLVRRPTGVWDDLYEVAQNGPVSTQDPTLPLVVLNETLGKIRVIYTSRTNGGDIQYKESSISNISFGNQLTLISGVNNNVTSTHQNFTQDVVILASNTTQVVGVLASDVPPVSPVAGMAEEALAEAALSELGVLHQGLLAYPNPLSSRATLSFALASGGEYSLALYESTSMDLVLQKQGNATAGAVNLIDLDASQLAKGLYFARLQTADGIKTLRLMIEK